MAEVPEEDREPFMEKRKKTVDGKKGKARVKGGKISQANRKRNK